MQKILSIKQMIWLFCFVITTPSSFSMEGPGYILSSTISSDKKTFVKALYQGNWAINEASMTLKGNDLFKPIFSDLNGDRNHRAGEIRIPAPYRDKQSASQDLTNFLHQEGYMNKNYRLEILSMEVIDNEIRVQNWNILKTEDEKDSLIQYIEALNLSKNIPIRIGSHINHLTSNELEQRLISEQQLNKVKQAIDHGSFFKKVFIDPNYKQETNCEMAVYLKEKYPRMTVQEIPDHSIKGFIAKIGEVELIYIAANIGDDGVELLKNRGYSVLWDQQAVEYHIQEQREDSSNQNTISSQPNEKKQEIGKKKNCILC